MADFQTIQGEPAAATEIFKRLLTAYDDKGTTDVAGLLCAAGALGGFASQQAVWKACIEPDKRNPGDFLVRATTKSGETLYFGEPINLFLQATSSGVYSFYSFVAGAVPDQSKLPDLIEIFRHVAATAGKPEFWTIRVQGPLGGFPKPKALLDTHWPWVQEVLIRHGNPATEWPVILGFVAHRAIKGGANATTAPLFARVVMETAILASKIDPRQVAGATSGFDPSGPWNNRAAAGPTQREVVDEVLPLLPRAIPR
ncbi:MAG TPA: hypothetical protein VGG48_19180 [Rhizomicrobium sp.]